MTTVRSLLESNEESPRGPLTGTDSQKEIVEKSLQHLDDDVEDFAATLDWSAAWVIDVLERADAEFINSVEGGGAVPMETDTDAVEDHTHERSVGIKSVTTNDGDVDIHWDTPDGVLVEIHDREYCADCGELKPVTYLVPPTEIRYLDPPDCGHQTRFGHRTVPYRQEMLEVRRSIDAVLRKNSGRTTFNANKR